MFIVIGLRRSAVASVAVSGTTLELPPQEYQQLRQLAVEGSGQIVLKLASECRPVRGKALEECKSSCWL